MRTVTLEGTMTALSSIAHGGGQSSGITSMLRREKFVQPDGSVEEVVVLSGNGLRGMLRDLTMWHMCQVVGYGEPGEDGRPRGLSLPAFHFLFSGGALTKVSGRGLDVDLARELRRTLPPVALFGGAVGNQIMPGKLVVDKAIPVCAETVHLLPRTYAEWDVGSIWDYTQQEMFTRKDDEKNENIRHLIDEQARALIEAEARSRHGGPLALFDEPVGDDAPGSTPTGQKQQMMYYVETLAAGTKLHWSVTGRDLTPVEFDALVTTLVLFSRHPYVGAKSGTGHGKVAIGFDDWHEIDSRIAHNGKAIDVPVGEKYSQHLQQQSQTIRDLLDAMG